MMNSSRFSRLSGGSEEASTTTWLVFSIPNGTTSWLARPPAGTSRRVVWVMAVLLASTGMAILPSLRPAGGPEADLAGADAARRLEGEGHDEVAGPLEPDGLRRLARDREEVVRFDADRDLLDLRLGDEDGDRHDHVLARSDDPRQGGQGHQVAPDGHGLLGQTEGAVAPGHDHDPDGP